MDEHFPKDTIESLWAPWRVEYFQAEHRSGVDFLSEAAATSDDAAHLVVARRPTAFLVMNKYPYSAGHLMAVPCRKVVKMSEVTEDEILDLWRLSIHAQRLLEIAVKAQGFNVGWNLGKAAAPASRTTCTSTSFQGGWATRISWPWSAEPASFPRD